MHFITYNFTTAASTQPTPVRQWFAALLLAPALLLAVAVQAQPVTQSVRLPNQEYTETRQDISVKVLGGYVAVQRTWAAGHWYINPAWANLQLLPDPMGGVLAVQRASSVYERTGSVAAQNTGSIYRFDANNLIERTATGWRWYDTLGNSIRYDAQGRIQNYSDPNGLTVSFVRNAQGQLSAITDHHGNTVLTLEADSEGRTTRIADTAGRSVRYQWQGTGSDSQLRQVTDLLGQTYTYTYNAQNQITQRTNPQGASLKLSYLTSPTPIPTSPGFAGMGAGDSAGGGTINGTASTGSTKAPLPPIARVASLQDETGATTLYRVEYNRARQQYTIHTQDPVGTSQSLTYNKDGLVLQNVKDGQAQAQRIIDSATQERLIDARGQTTTIHYDSAHRPLKTTYPDGSAEIWQYNAQGRPTRQTTPQGTINTWAYDARGNLTQHTQALGLPEQTTTLHTYDQWGQRTSTTQGAGSAQGPDAQTTTTAYDSAGNPTQTTNPLGHTRRATYNSAGHLLTQTDPLGHTTTYQYDPTGKLLQTTNPLGHSSTHQYDSLGRKTQTTNPLGHTSTTSYDNLGRITEQRQPGHPTPTRLAYDSAGRNTSTTTPGGLVSTTSYDALGRIRQTTDPAGNTTQYEYAAEGTPLAGLLIAVHYPTFSETYRYDQRGRKTQTTQVLGAPVSGQTNPQASTQTQQQTWDVAGQRTSATNPAGQTTLYHYDALGRLVKTTDTQNNATAQTWDAHSRLTSVTDAAGNTHRFAYDKAGQLITETRPSGTSTQYQYDAAGQLTQRTDAAGNIRRYTWDGAGRLVQEQHLLAGTQADQTITYQYDAAGQLVAYQQKDANGQTISSATYTKDPLGRTLQTATTYGTNLTHTVAQAYTADGQLSGHTWPDGSASQYTYSQGKLTGITLPTHSTNAPQTIGYSQYQWMQAGSIQTPGTTKTQTFDALQRPLGIAVKGVADQTLLSRTYQYDPAGNITRMASELGSTQYSYDSLNRLTQANPDAALQTLGLPQEQYSYDGVHNRTSSAHQAGAWAYNQDNQLVQYPELKNSQALPTQVQYNAQGHTAGETNSQGTKIYRYNVAERLIEVSQTTTNGSTTSTIYRYDPLGRRISKTNSQGASTTTTYFVYNSTGLMAELNAQGHMTKAYGFNPQLAQSGLWSTDPLWQAEVSNNSLKDPATQIHYLHTDHLGTPMLATDKTGQTTWKGISEAFGLMRVDNASSIAMNLRFPGQYWDGETGSHYNYFRDYRSNTGRYVQSDPIGLKGGVNIYGYVAQQPMSRIDAIGLFSSGADYALMWHFFGGSGEYFDISPWCKDYVADEQVKGVIEVLKMDIKIQNKKLLGLDGVVPYQVKNNRHLVISLLSIYSFGAGNGHMQDADCVATGDGCCVESKCAITAKAFDRFTDPIDLCQRWGVCSGIRELGGTAFNFGLSCASNFSVKDCKSDCCKN